MTLEGAMGPNNRLDDADAMRVDRPDALCVGRDGQLYFSSGNRVHALEKWGDKPRKWAAFDRPVTALCSGPDGNFAVGLEDGRIALLDAEGNERFSWSASDVLKLPRDCEFVSGDEIIAVDNGYGADADFMSVAPWDETAKGRVVALSPNGSPNVVASALRCPMGIVRDAVGDWIVSLFENASIVDLTGTVRQSGFPAYPGRIHRTANGYVMACLARRDPLIEFLKTEKEFIAEMKATIEPRFWISPRANPEFSHDFPIEAGATRVYGEIKPWAPSFSYGLVIELDADLLPIASAHSRANGQRHNITDAVVWNGELFAVSGASGEILKVGRESDPA
jgi:hypothetical protein